MRNIIFAMGEQGEFGRTLELHKALVAQATDEELRALPKNGLPWNCRPDMLFFRTMTNGIASETGYNAYEQLRGHFPQNQLVKLVSGAQSPTARHNVLLAGKTTYMGMSLPESRTRIMLPVSREIMNAQAFLTLSDMAAHLEERDSDVWFVGGANLLFSALAEHALGDLKIDNMFISTIKGKFASDILIDQERLMMYIDSDFTYNDEYAENNEVIIQRYRGNKK